MNKYVVNCDSIAHNAALLKREMSEIPIIGVVKGNGYGLKTVPFAKELLKSDIKTLAVARISEARELRNAEIEAPIMMLTPVFGEKEAEELVNLSLIACVDSQESAVVLNSIAEKHAQIAEIQIKLETGFGRFGFAKGDEQKILQIAKHMKNLCITGVFTHISNPYGTNRNSLDLQIEKFTDIIKKLESENISLGIKHVANSATALKYPELRMDSVRIGSAFLGRLPIKDKWGFRRVGYLRSEIAEIKWLEKGMNIGYADVYKTKKPTKIAIVLAGHTDGFGISKMRDTYRFRDSLRYIANDIFDILRDKHIYGVINGKKARMLGRVGLTNIVFDITNISCSTGDSVILETSPLTVSETVEREYGME